MDEETGGLPDSTAARGWVLSEQKKWQQHEKTPVITNYRWAWGTKFYCVTTFRIFRLNVTKTHMSPSVGP